jgi:beta-lactamase regulating signal transducer with metallopeptidase domain
MDPSLGLQVASGLVTFILKTTLEWLVCLLLVRIAATAKSRFNLWLMMLLGFVVQWVWMFAGVVRAVLPLGASTLAMSAGRRVAVAAPEVGWISAGIAALVVLYVAVLAWRLLGMVAAHIRLRRALRFKAAPAATVVSAFEQILAESMPDEKCAVWMLPGVGSPATVGWLRPQIILPQACQTQDAAELKTVFWHELKHVQRRDVLWNSVVSICRNLLWFHPAAHYATQALTAQRELACDAAVVQDHPHSRDIYASCLVRFARMRDLSPSPSIGTVEMASRTGLLATRVKSILSDGPALSTCRGAANVALLGLMAGTVPALNVLFAAEQAQASFVTRAALAAPAPNEAKRRGLRLEASREGLMPTPAGERTAAGGSLLVQHDEALAAEHRAAMGILTESTGMDDSSRGDARTASGVDGKPGRGVGAGTTSWGAVALDAAARMGPLLGNDHDADDHK